MRPLSSTVALSILLMALPHAAAAEVVVSISGGRASVRATDATTVEILTEWARVGQTTIVNLEKVDTGRVTLALDDVPERMALDVILRTAAGFVAIPRSLDEAGASRFARILILPRTSRAADADPQPVGERTITGSGAPLVAPEHNDPDAVASEPVAVEPLLGPDGEPIPDDQDDLDLDHRTNPAPDSVAPSPADELRPDGAVVPAQPR